MTTRNTRRTALVLTAALALGCGGAPEDEDIQQAFQPSYLRLQNTEATFARRCVVSGGANGAVVGGAICNNLNENQGYLYDATSLKRNWLKTQGTGPAKCLAVTAANTLVNAVCTESTANQTWTKLQITGTSRFTYANAGKCLTMATDGVLSVATCTPGARTQEWVQGNDQTLNEVLPGGELISPDIPTGKPDVVVPATAGTIAYTEGAFTTWELTYIKYQPTNVFFESRGIVVVARDQFGAARFYTRALHINDPRTPKDIHHTYRTLLTFGSASLQQIDVNMVNGQPKATVVNNIPNVTAHSTAIALLLRDVQAYRAAHGYGPVTPLSAAGAVARAAVPRPVQDVATDLTVSDITTAALTALDIIVVEAGCPLCGAIIATIPLLRKVFPDNPPGGTPNCGSRKTTVDGDTGQCTAHPIPECPACGGTGQPKCTNSCAVQNSHSLPTTSSHGGPIACSTVIAPHPGRTCTKSPIPPANTMCWLDCTQTHSECQWAWCQIPPK